MSNKAKRLSCALLLTISTMAFSEDGTGNYNLSNMSGDMSNLTQYLKNLGEYFGYDLTQYCQSGGPCSNNGQGTGSAGSSGNFSNALLNLNGTYQLELNLFNSYLGALIGGGVQASNPIIPPNAAGASVINTLSGQTYTIPPYASPSTQAVSVVTGIDQETYQADPVSQFLLNLMTTPDVSYCLDALRNNEGGYQTNCSILFREKVMSQVIGTLPPARIAFSNTNNSWLVPQVNSDTLMSPLLYTTNNPAITNSTSSSPTTNNTANGGLNANTQAQQASNFIRYVTGSVTPLLLPSFATYESLVAQALNYSKQVPPKTQAKAQTILLDYLTKFRSYAAQSSVGVSNLYYILSKRLPQKPLSGSGGASSEALNEFLMASWRLYNPNQSDSSGGRQWLTQINQASNATVQKEIAILLAEINYQLYLSRQQQERLLLTESVLLLQNTRMGAPTLTADELKNQKEIMGDTSQ